MEPSPSHSATPPLPSKESLIKRYKPIWRLLLIFNLALGGQSLSINLHFPFMKHIHESQASVAFFFFLWLMLPVGCKHFIDVGFITLRILDFYGFFMSAVFVDNMFDILTEWRRFFFSLLLCIYGNYILHFYVAGA